MSYEDELSTSVILPPYLSNGREIFEPITKPVRDKRPFGAEIEERARSVFELLTLLDVEDKIATINALRALLHEHSPFNSEPVDFVKWVKNDEIVANDYNPNSVAPLSCATIIGAKGLVSANTKALLTRNILNLWSAAKRNGAFNWTCLVMRQSTAISRYDQRPLHHTQLHRARLMGLWLRPSRHAPQRMHRTSTRDLARRGATERRPARGPGSRLPERPVLDRSRATELVLMKNPLRVLSLGAGVQSTTLALMIARGDLPPVDCAIFADTGWEPAAVYEHLAWLQTVLPFPVHIVSAGNIRNDAIAKTNSTGQRFASVPWFTLNRGKVGMGRRQCTKEYKLRPLQKKVVELMGGKRPRGGCEMLIGISQDEAWRRKPSQVQYITNTFPLLDRQMTRQDCLRWMEERQQPRPPKSSCIGCPFHDDSQWRALSPEEFADAVLVDRAIRAQPGIRAQQFMHRSCKPLDHVDFSTAEDRGQLNLFLNECEGMCGV